MVFQATVGWQPEPQPVPIIPGLTFYLNSLEIPVFYTSLSNDGFGILGCWLSFIQHDYNIVHPFGTS